MFRSKEWTTPAVGSNKLNIRKFKWCHCVNRMLVTEEHNWYEAAQKKMVTMIVIIFNGFDYTINSTSNPVSRGMKWANNLYALTL